MRIAERLVFIDESGASTKMTRLYGRCPRGKRLVCAVPHGHWKTATFIGALRRNAMTGHRIFDGPTLRKHDIVVMVNLYGHKVAGVREAIEATRATLRYLPP